MGKPQVETLIKEPLPLLRERRGGAINVILAALILEAVRMVDEGHDIPTIEHAARLSFKAPGGFLTLADEIGVHACSAFLFYLSDASEPEDPFFQIYDNFFEPPESCTVMLEKYNTAEDKHSITWVTAGALEEPVRDFMVLSLLKKRFQAVAYMTAVEVVEAGLLDLRAVDVSLKNLFGWGEGPFAQMNAVGIREALQMVTEKMELSHRKEINFPVPRLLIDQARYDRPWPLNSDAESKA